MGNSNLLASLRCLLCVGAVVAAEHNPEAAAQELEEALKLAPDPTRGRDIDLLCAVCHQPEGWGTSDGEYPQIAGQHYGVIIK